MGSKYLRVPFSIEYFLATIGNISCLSLSFSANEKLPNLSLASSALVSISKSLPCQTRYSELNFLNWIMEFVCKSLIDLLKLFWLDEHIFNNDEDAFKPPCPPIIFSNPIVLRV